MKNPKRHSVIVVAAVMVALAALSTGCSGSSGDTDKTAGGNGKSTVAQSGDESAKSAPKGWPAGIPLPSDFEPLTDNTVEMSGKVTLNWAGTTSDSVDEITQMYKTNMTGWAIADAGTVKDQPSNSYLGFTRGEESLMVNISDSGEERTLNLSYSAG